MLSKILYADIENDHNRIVLKMGVSRNMGIMDSIKVYFRSFILIWFIGLFSVLTVIKDILMPWYRKHRIAPLTLADTRNLKKLQPVSPFVESDFSFAQGAKDSSDEDMDDVMDDYVTQDADYNDDADQRPAPDDSLHLYLSDSTFDASGSFRFSGAANDSAMNSGLEDQLQDVHLDDEPLRFVYHTPGKN